MQETAQRNKTLSLNLEIVLIFVRNELGVSLESIGIDTLTLIIFLITIFSAAFISVWLFSKKNGGCLKNSFIHVFKANLMYIFVFFSLIA